jgi:hypothetical protein
LELVRVWEKVLEMGMDPVKVKGKVKVRDWGLGMW